MQEISMLGDLGCRRLKNEFAESKKLPDWDFIDFDDS
jgi:hypothetical protein